MSRSLAARLRSRLRSLVRDRAVGTEQNTTPPAPPPWAMPQLPARAADLDEVLDPSGGGSGRIVPNRLPPPDASGAVVVDADVIAGPWRDVGSSTRAAMAMDLRRLTGADAGPGATPAEQRAREHGGNPTHTCSNEEERGWVEWLHPELAGGVELRGRERPAAAPRPGGQARLGVVGYDLKFLDDLLGRMRDTGAVEPVIDQWDKFRVASGRTEEVVGDVDVVLAEWCGPNAVIASRAVRPDQRLVVRLHRFELDEPEWRDVRIDAVDAVVAVSEPYRRRILEVTGWPSDKVVVVPNSVDVHQLDREKLESARWTIGMLGSDRSRKRLDRALDLLELLLETDPRWQLRVKGTTPWASRWVGDRPDEVAFFERVLQRLDEEPLRSSVVFDAQGPDVASWFRGIGFILSPSEDESFHLAPAEGMASGTVPLLWPWPGAEEIYAPEWVVADTAAAADRITSLAADPDRLHAASVRARSLVESRYRLEHVAERFLDVLLG